MSDKWTSVRSATTASSLNGISGNFTATKLLVIFPEAVVRVGSRIIPVKPIGVTGGIKVFAPWIVALPDFVKRVNEIQFPYRVVNHLTSQPDGMLQSHQSILSRGSKNPAVQTQAGYGERTAKEIAFAGVRQVSAL